MDIEELEVFDELPLPFCVFKVEVTEQNEPIDLVFVYANKACAKTESELAKSITGKSLPVLFKGSSHWLDLCYKTAWLGINQQITEYSLFLQKHFRVNLYTTSKGYCNCLYEDLTEAKKIEAALEESKIRTSLILRNISDKIFLLDPETMKIYDDDDILINGFIFSDIPNIPYALVERGYIDAETAPVISEAIKESISSDKPITCTILTRFDSTEEFRWHELTLCAYDEKTSQKRKIIGHLRDVHEFVLQKDQIDKMSKSDTLTGLYNMKAGRELIEQILKKQTEKSFREIKQNAFLIINIDDFKAITTIFGNRIGDRIVQKMSKVLSKLAPENSVVFRIGNDDFAIFIPEVSETILVLELCKNIQETFSSELDKGIELTLSIGGTIGKSFNLYHHYYENAENNLKFVKQNGKNSYRVKELD